MPIPNYELSKYMSNLKNLVSSTLHDGTDELEIELSVIDRNDNRPIFVKERIWLQETRLEMFSRLKSRNSHSGYI